MKLRIFHSDKGDCILVTGSGGGRILSDGGMKTSFVAHVAKHLQQEDPIDLVCVSHIDADHIEGILELLDNAMAWKVFHHHQSNGDNDFNEPDVPAMPQVKRIWHNAFHDQLKENAGEIADLLAAMVPVLSNIDDPELVATASRNEAIVNSNEQAIRVSQRLRPEQLDIPLNENAKLIMVRDDQKSFAFGSLSLRIVAPFAADLDTLRKDWNKWLSANKATITKLRQQAKKDAGSLEDNVEAILAPAFAATELGDRKQVTPPNLASIMLYVEDGGKKLLLTGDGHADDAIKGLDHLGNVLKPDGTLHLDILKIQHHGSEHNMTKDFARRITADHYVFCGNGFSGNPEPVVLDTIFDARTGGAGPNRPFKFWFNSSEASEAAADRRKHMRETEAKIKKMTQKNNRLQSFFLREDDFVDMTP